MFVYVHVRVHVYIIIARRAVSLGASPNDYWTFPPPTLPDALCPDTHELWTQLFLEMHTHDMIERATGMNRWRALRDHDLEETAWSRVAFVVDNVFINFTHRSPRTFWYFLLFETFVYQFFYFGDQMISLWRTCCWQTISMWDDQMYRRCELWPRKWFLWIKICT